jgi:hypothetical protein
MKRKTRLLVLVTCLGILMLGQAARAVADTEPRVGINIGNVSFSAPVTAQGAAYLGLRGQTPFTLSDIKAPYVVVESMNIY